MSNYSVHKGEIRKRLSPVILRSFPQYNSKPHDENYGRYCKYQLIKYKPWRTKISEAWQDLPDDDTTYIEAYKTFLHTPQATTCVPHFADELDRAEQHIAGAESSDSENEDSPTTEQHEDWMLLCRLNHHYIDSTVQEDSINWCEAAQSLPPEILQDCPRWIKTKRKESESNPHVSWHRQLPQIDVNTLNSHQNTAYDIVCHHQHQFIAGNNPSPLRMIICCTASTGKSYLISAIAHTLGTSCLLTATTGMAAFNICGQTLHSALQLPIRSCTFKDLQGSSLQRLQLTMKDKSYLIIDEMQWWTNACIRPLHY